MHPTYEDLVKLCQEQRCIIEELRKEIVELCKRIADLEERLNLNSKNSSKPPSSDQKPNKDISRKGGAQKGHLGHHRQLVSQVTRVVENKPAVCKECGSLTVTLEKPWIFQQVEIPKIELDVTEYRCFGCRCKNCGLRQAPELPVGVEYSAFGPQLSATAALLTGQFRLSKRQAKLLLKIALKIDVSVGSISNIEGRMAVALVPAHEDIRQKIVNSIETMHIDETGMRQEYQRRTLWVMSTISAVYLSIRKGRGKKDLREFLPDDARGPTVTDRYGVYDFAEHQWCWAHLVRDFRRFSERDGPDGRIGKSLVFEGTAMLKSNAQRRNGILDKKEARRRILYRKNRIKDRLLDAFLEGSKQFRTFAEKCMENAQKLWLFCAHPGVEPTNNQAERDLRPSVIWRKICYGTQSDRGTHFIERIGSVIATLQRCKSDVLTFLHAAYRARFDSTCPSPQFLYP